MKEFFLLLLSVSSSFPYACLPCGHFVLFPPPICCWRLVPVHLHPLHQHNIPNKAPPPAHLPPTPAVFARRCPTTALTSSGCWLAIRHSSSSSSNNSSINHLHSAAQNAFFCISAAPIDSHPQQQQTADDDRSAVLTSSRSIRPLFFFYISVFPLLSYFYRYLHFLLIIFKIT